MAVVHLFFRCPVHDVPIVGKSTCRAKVDVWFHVSLTGKAGLDTKQLGMCLFVLFLMQSRLLLLQSIIPDKNNAFNSNNKVSLEMLLPFKDN